MKCLDDAKTEKNGHRQKWEMGACEKFKIQFRVNLYSKTTMVVGRENPSIYGFSQIQSCHFSPVFGFILALRKMGTLRETLDLVPRKNRRYNLKKKRIMP